MSNAALTWAFSVDGVTPAEKLVLLALADQANGDDRCWPQQAETAKRCCLRPESVNRAIKSLAAKQLIDIEGTGQRRRYRLRMTSDHTENSMTTDQSQYDATSISDCAQVIPSMTTDQSPIDNPNKPSLTQTNPNRAREVENEFRTWWQGYPHKVGKQDARRKFEIARRQVSLEVLLAGVERYVESKPPDRQWANPATWLHQGRWEDAPAPVSVGNGRRETGPPAFPTSPLNADESTWRWRVKWFSEKGMWMPDWGGKPGESACYAAPVVLREFGYLGQEAAE